MLRRFGDGRPMTTSPGRDVGAGDDAVAFDHADGEADEIELAGFHRPGVLGHLAADERAAGLPAAVGDALDQLLDVIGVEPADGDVVEEEQRLGALADEVVDAHRHQVDADRLEPAGALRDERLRADAVGRGHQHRVGGSGSVSNPNRPPKPPMSPITSGRKVDCTICLDARHRLFTGADAHARGFVGLAHAPELALQLSLRRRACSAGIIDSFSKISAMVTPPSSGLGVTSPSSSTALLRLTGTSTG